MDKFITTLNNILHIAVTVAGIALLIIVYHWASAAYRPPVVTPNTQYNMQTWQGVQQAGLQSNFRLPQYQANDFAKAADYFEKKLLIDKSPLFKEEASMTIPSAPGIFCGSESCSSASL